MSAAWDDLKRLWLGVAIFFAQTEENVFLDCGRNLRNPFFEMTSRIDPERQ